MQAKRTFVFSYPDPSFLGAAWPRAINYRVLWSVCMGPLDLGQCSVTYSVEVLVVLSSLLRKPGDRVILQSAASLSECSTLGRGNLGDQTSQDLGMFWSSNQLCYSYLVV